MSFGTKLIILAAFWLCIAECAISYEDHDDNVAEESGEIAQNSYVLPKQIFNDGKPFYLEKNPLSDTLDFNSKKTSLLTSPEAISHLSDKDITLNSNNIQAPNLYDYLNLPVKYTSSKFVYPLVSSSYANLKYQGNNKNFVSNHKNDTTTNKVSPPTYGYSSYLHNGHTGNEHVDKKTTNITESSSTTQISTQKTSTATTTTTTPKPIEQTTTKTTSTMRPPTTIQELPTTRRPQFTRPPNKYTTNKYKYSTIRKRPYITMESTDPTVTMEHSPTTPRTPQTTESTTLRPISTFHPTHAFRPLPVTSVFTTQGSADVYANMATAITSTPKPKRKDPNDMSLSELFNSLLDDDEESTAGTIDEDDHTVIESNTLKDKFMQTNQHNITFQNQPQNQSDLNASYNTFQNGHIHVTSSQETTPQPSLANQNKIVFTNEPTLTTNSKPIIEVSTGTPAPVDNFNFDVGYNAPMHPQGFTLASTTRSPLTPPLFPVIEEQLVMRPEQPSSSIRFPVRNHFDNAPIVNGIYKHEPNGHGAPPLALPQQGNGLVVFPANQQQISTSVGVDPVFQGATSNQSNFVSFGFDKPSMSVESSAGNPVKFVNIPMNPSGEPEEIFQVPVQAEMNYPSMTNDLSAPFPTISNPQLIEDQNARPNRLHLTQKQKQQLQQHAQEQQNQLQQRPPPPHHQMQQKPPQQFQQLPHERYQTRPMQNENFSNKPSMHNPNAQRQPAIGDRLLPNILPQFRPNAKIGYGANNGGHPKDNMDQMRQPPPQFNNRRVQQNMQRPPPPQFRRPALPGLKPATSFNVKMAPVSAQNRPDEQQNPNRRYFQQRPNNNERLYNVYPPQPQTQNHPQSHHRFIEENPHVQSSAGVLDASLIAAKETLQTRQVEPSTELLTKLEPVITLQQLQHQKMLQKDGLDQQLLGQQTFNPDAPVAVHTASDKPPVYVVYPVKTSPLKLEVVGEKDIDDAVVVGHRGEHPPMPPSDIEGNPAAGNEYQNTPFTVIRQEQKPILVVKPKLRFPYPLQRPNGELVQQDRLINIKPTQNIDSEVYDESSYNIGEKPVGHLTKHESIASTTDTDEDFESTKKIYR